MRINIRTIAYLFIFLTLARFFLMCLNQEVVDSILPKRLISTLSRYKPDFSYLIPDYISCNKEKSFFNKRQNDSEFAFFNGKRISLPSHRGILNMTEEFTIVIMTYMRDSLLLEAVKRLRGLPCLNKIVIIRNSGKAPSPLISQKLRNVGIPIQEVLSEKNSLSNRFLPNNAIETESILSLDDDVYLSHDAILVGFRAWQTNRNQLVGFIKRCHLWDRKKKQWHYTYDPCENNKYSIALTGAAFLSVYYTYAYTYQMTQRIREYVDKEMNCEDIAMNFLVAHLTHKPPMIVASNVSLIDTKKQLHVTNNPMDHFAARDICFNYFTQVFGYMPLLFNQFEVVKCEHR